MKPMEWNEYFLKIHDSGSHSILLLSYVEHYTFFLLACMIFILLMKGYLGGWMKNGSRSLVDTYKRYIDELMMQH